MGIISWRRERRRAHQHPCPVCPYHFQLLVRLEQAREGHSRPCSTRAPSQTAHLLKGLDGRAQSLSRPHALSSIDTNARLGDRITSRAGQRAALLLARCGVVLVQGWVAGNGQAILKVFSQAQVRKLGFCGHRRTRIVVISLVPSVNHPAQRGPHKRGQRTSGERQSETVAP